MAATYAPVARTPLHAWHSRHAARLILRDGWELPDSYGNPEAELRAARTGVGIVDLSSFAKLSLLGRGLVAGAAALIGADQATRPRTVTRMDAASPVLACRLTEDHILLLASGMDAAALTARFTSFQEQHGLLRNDATCNLAGLGIIGPRAWEILSRLTHLDGRALPTGFCIETALAGVHAMLVHPPDQDLQRILVYVAWDLGQYAWEKVLDTGKEYDARPLGLLAWGRLASNAAEH
jgi:glycine cleavage system aminomethyltransferase T